MPGGTLLITVFEAKNLIAKAGPPDPYCTIMIDKNAKTKHKTKKKSKTLSPSWEEEFRYEVEHKDHVLKFQIKGSRFGKAHLGTCEVPVESLKPVEENNLWLDLQGEPGTSGSVGQLHVNIFWIPLGATCPPQLARKVQDQKKEELPPISPTRQSDKKSSSTSSLPKPSKMRGNKGWEESDGPDLGGSISDEDKKLGIIAITALSDGSSSRIITPAAKYNQEYAIGYLSEGSVLTLQVGAGGTVALGFDSFDESGEGWFRVDDAPVPAQLQLEWKVNTLSPNHWARYLDILDGGVGGMLFPSLFLIILQLGGGLNDYIKGILHTILAMVFVRCLAVMISSKYKNQLAAQALAFQQQQLHTDKENFTGSQMAVVPAVLKTEKLIKLKIITIKEMKVPSIETSTVPKTTQPTSSLTFDKPLHYEQYGGWSEADPSPLIVRGQNYLQDRKKVSAGRYHFELVYCDITHNFEGKMNHAASRPDSWINKQKSHEDFIFVVNWQVPGTPRFNVVCYFQAPKPKKPGELDEKESHNVAVFNRALERFLDGSSKYRDARFKMIPRVVEGAWVVQKGVGTTPAILGTKMTQSYYENRELNYFEVDVDIGSSKVAGQVLKLVKGYATSVVVDLSFLIEGQQQDELPEQLLGGVRLHRINPDNTPRALNVESDSDDIEK